MIKIKLFFNKNYKILILIFSINPIINIIFDDKSKGFFFRNSIYFYLIGFISIIFYGLYLVNNERILNKIQIEKITLGIFTLSNVFLSFYGFGLLYIYIYSILIASIIYVILRVLVTRYSSKINSTKDSELKLYESRKPSKERILKILNENSKSLILVDGEWGIGKTFFMDRVLEEEKNIYYEKKELLNPKNILAVKVDVLLFNEKKQMINFVMEDIHKVLLEKGIRSSSIRKYLSAINDGVNNKFAKALYKLFSDEKTENIENNIKDDIKSLNGEKLVIVVDNLERTLDKKITIDILGFLHYIYEKLGVNIVVLADSHKLKDEIGNEVYLKKFFIETIYLSQVNYEEIIGKIEEDNRFLFKNNIRIQCEVEDLYGEKYKELSIRIEDNIKNIGIIEFQLDKGTNKEIYNKPKLEKETAQLDKYRKELDCYTADYNRLSKTFGNPRAYKTVVVRYNEWNFRIMNLYNFNNEELKKFENIILKIAFYEEVYGNMKFEKTKFSEEFPITSAMLYSNYEENTIGLSLVELINHSNDDILEAIKVIENISINISDIGQCLQQFEIYYTAFNSYKERITKLYEFYKTKKDDFFEFLNNPENMKYLFSSRLKYSGLVYIDRMYYLENNNSILTKLYSENQFLKSREGNNDNDINGAILKLTKKLLSNIYNRTIDDYPNEFDYNFRHIVSYNSGKMSDLTDVDINKTIRDIKEKLNSSNLFNLEKKYVEYFLVCFENYFGKIKANINYQNSKINEFLNTLVAINELKEKINFLGTSVEEQFSFKKHKFELDNLESKRLEIRKKLHTNYGYSINTSEELQNKIDISKRIFELSNDIEDIINYEFSNSNSGTIEFSKLYEEFVKKGFKPDKDFEKLFYPKGVKFNSSDNVIENEENHDL